MKEKFIIVEWPEVQEFMDEDGFDENSYPILDEKGVAEFGNSAYFVNEKWINKVKTIK